MKHTRSIRSLITQALDANPSPTVALDADGIVLVANRAWEQMNPELVIIGKDFGSQLHETSRPDYRSVIVYPSINQVNLTLNGSYLPADATIVRWPSDGQSDIAFVVYATLPSKQDHKDEWLRLRRLETRWKTALACAGHAAWDTWNDEGSHYVSPSWYTIRGFDPSDADSSLVKNWMDRVHPEDQPRLRQSYRAQTIDRCDIVDYKYRFKAKDGSWIWIQSKGRVLSRLPDGSPARLVGVDSNVTDEVAIREELEKAQAQLIQESRTDPLTGISNRRAMDDHVGNLTAQAAAAGVDATFTLILIDLDGFKKINDTYGHNAGDTVLVHIASMIAATFDDGSLTARLGGDEFCIVTTQAPTEQSLASKLRQLQTAACAPIQVLEERFTLSLSIGVAANAAPNTGYSCTLRKADQALYQAKAAGKNCVQYFDDLPPDPLAPPERTD